MTSHSIFLAGMYLQSFIRRKPQRHFLLIIKKNINAQWIRNRVDTGIMLRRVADIYVVFIDQGWSRHRVSPILAVRRAFQSTTMVSVRQLMSSENFHQPNGLTYIVFPRCLQRRV